MDLEKIAALCAIIGFVIKVFQPVWVRCSVPIKKYIKRKIEKITNFLTWFVENFLN